MLVSAHDVADELRKRFADVGVVKLHKLLYYAQGWHLVARGEPLFAEEIRAWSNGPVVATLWADEKHERPRPDARPLSDEHLATIDYVASRYGDLTGKQLILLTHAEDPWRDVSETDDVLTVSDPVIQHEALQKWFASVEEQTRYRADLERMRARTDIYTFDAAPLSPSRQAHLRDALSGPQIVEARPT